MTFGTLQQSYSIDCAQPQARLSDYYIVPTDKSLGYNALTHSLPYGSTKYFGINGAYPASCTTFGYRKASGNQIIRSTSVMRPS